MGRVNGFHQMGLFGQNSNLDEKVEFKLDLSNLEFPIPSDFICDLVARDFVSFDGRDISRAASIVRARFGRLKGHGWDPGVDYSKKHMKNLDAISLYYASIEYITGFSKNRDRTY